MPEFFIIQVNEERIKKEREKARALRKTRWWKQRLARGICYYCRHRFPPAELSMDHVVPLIRGGKTTKGNLVTVCKECNSQKKYLLPMEWEAYVQNSLGKKEEKGKPGPELQPKERPARPVDQEEERK